MSTLNNRLKLKLPEALCPEVSASFARPFARANRGYPSSLFDPCPRLSNLHVFASNFLRVPSRDESDTRLVVFFRILWKPLLRSFCGVLAVASFARSTGSVRQLFSTYWYSTNIHSSQDISTIRERSMSRGTKIAHCLRDGKRKSVALPSGRKRYASSRRAPGELSENSRRAWRTENTLAPIGRTRSGKSRGRRTDDVSISRRFRSTKLKPDDAIDAMAYATSRSV